MLGQLVPVWKETWPHIWSKLLAASSSPDELAVELFGAFSAEPQPPLEPPPPEPEAYDADGILVDAEALERDSKYKSQLEIYKRDLARYQEALNGKDTKKALRAVILSTGGTEEAAIKALEGGFLIAEEFGGDELSNRFYILVDAFLRKFSLRYDLRRPLTLHPTLPGIFASMMRDLKAITQNDADLQPIYLDFEESFRDLTADRSERLIKICIQRQMILLEALGQKNPGVTANTLGRICDQVGANGAWPHASVNEAMKSLYKFACDYPGIRHAGTPANSLRAIETKDMVAVSVLLAGFTPYLSHQLDAAEVYRR